MALTPVEIRHLTPPRTTFRGYHAETTDKLLEEIAASFEDVWRERADLADKVEQLESDLERFRELEALLRTTLISAERTAAELKAQWDRFLSFWRRWFRKCVPNRTSRLSGLGRPPIC